MPKTKIRSAKLQDYLKPIPRDKPIGLHYKTKMAAWLLGKSTKWIYKEIEEGRLDGFILGHDIVVSLESINARLEMARITGQARDAAVSDDFKET